MSRLPHFCAAVFAAGILIPGTFAQNSADVQKPADDHKLSVMVGKALIIDSEADIVRVAVAGPTLAEAVGVNPREVLVNGLLPGETSLVIWEVGGARLVYDLNVSPNTAKLDAVRRQLATEFEGDAVTLDLEGDTVFLRGRVKDLMSAARAVTISSTLGKVVNLLYVDDAAGRRAGSVEGPVPERRALRIVSTGREPLEFHGAVELRVQR